MSPDETGIRNAFELEAKRLIVDSTYTGRGHQAAGNRWATYNYWLGLPTAVASALLSGGAGISAVVDRHAWLTAILAFGAAISTASHGFLRPGERAEEHALKGNRFIALRNDARLFLELDLRTTMAADKLSNQIRDLRKRYADLNETPPLHIPRQDYEAAKQSIEAGESSYENDPIWKELSS
jgi:hypothetical protein